jgi:hypothetical protein
MTEKTYKIRSWNCATQSFESEREVTLPRGKQSGRGACEGCG